MHDHSQPAHPAHVQIMSNPNRARGGYINGRGGHLPAPMSQVVANGHGRGGSVSGSVNHVNGRGVLPTPPNQVNGRGNVSHYAASDSTAESAPTTNSIGSFRGGSRGRGYGAVRGRGGFNLHANGFHPRGAPRGGMRGRGRASFSPVVS